MRRFLLPLAALCLAFAPAPLPRKKGGEALVEVTVRLRVLVATQAAADCGRLLGPGGQVAVEPITNSLILWGRKADVDRTLAAIEQHEGGS